MSGSEAAREEEMLLDVDWLLVSWLPLGDLAGREEANCPQTRVIDWMWLASSSSSFPHGVDDMPENSQDQNNLVNFRDSHVMHLN